MTPLRVLVVEDSEDDYDLLLRELRRGTYDVQPRRVQTSTEMKAALAEETLDLVISDFTLPTFGAVQALAVLAESGIDIPFIIVSGTVSDDIAVDALRAGAHDFMPKNRLARLLPAIERELREAQTRKSRREEEALRQKAEEQLLVADRMVSIGTLAAGVAHEINNPLAALMANLDLAVRDLESVDRAALPPVVAVSLREELADARSAAERVRNIVRDLKIFSRGGDHEERGPVDVQRVLESTLRMARNEIRHRARLVTDYGKVPHVLGTESRLGQVFLNLVVNAAQALQEGSADRNEIRVTTGAEDGRVVVRVADTGPGIPPEVRGRLFTPFVTTKPVGVGTGLGLSICHRLVTELGGEIAVESTSKAGTCFRVTLPVAVGPAPAVVPEAPETASVRRARVLVIDDDPMVAKAVARTLMKEHDVAAVTRAAEALETMRAGERYDVILCDLMMPEMTGMEFHAALKATDPSLADAIVFLSGGAFTERARRFLESVPNRRLDKPFDARSLRAAINERLR